MFTKWYEGKKIPVKEYLKMVINEELPLVEAIYIDDTKITLEELIRHHLNEEAVFFNNEKYEYDDESEWSINCYELLLEKQTADEQIIDEKIIDDTLIFIEETYFDD